MANPQTENGHTDIANEIMEALARTRIPGEARQILDVILRKTYGWHKKNDTISLSQFAKATGLSKVHVCRAINKLVSMNIVTQKGNAISLFTKKGNDICVSYCLQKDYESWKTLPKKVTCINHVTQKGKVTLPKKVTTKENYTKEKDIPRESTVSLNTKSLSPNPSVKLFIDWYHGRFSSAFGEKPKIEGGKDGALVKRLLKTYSLEKLIELGERFFTSNDNFIQQSGYTLGVFSAVINKLLIEGKTGGDPTGGKYQRGPDLWYQMKMKELEEEKSEKDD